MRNFVTLLGLIVVLALVIPASAQETLDLIAPEILRRAMLAEDRGDNDNALVDYSLAILLNPTNYELYLLRSELYLSQGNNEAALADLDRSLRLSPENNRQVQAYLLTTRGTILLENDENQAALAELDAAVEADPTSPFAIFNRALVKARLGDLAGAVADYSQAIDLAPEFVEAYKNRAELHFTLEDYAAAIDDYTQVLELAPSLFQVYYGRGDANLELGNYEAAIADYSAAIERDPEPPIAVFLVRGDLNAQIGNYEDALADYDQLIEVIPDNPALWLVRGHYNNSANHDSDGARDFFQWLTLIEQRRLEADPLALGDTVAVEMNEGWTYRIPFEARAGQEIVITAASLQVDPLVVLLDTGGVPIASDDDSGGGLDAAISGFNVPDHGTYTIVLGHARGGSSGSVTVKVASVGD